MILAKSLEDAAAIMRAGGFVPMGGGILDARQVRRFRRASVVADLAGDPVVSLSLAAPLGQPDFGELVGAVTTSECGELARVVLDGIERELRAHGRKLQADAGAQLDARIRAGRFRVRLTSTPTALVVEWRSLNG